MTAAVILAAGASRRFEGSEPKLLTAFRGRPLASWTLDAVSAAGFDEVIIVVAGCNITPLVSTEIVIVNPDWNDGIATSLTRGVAEADRRKHDIVVVGLADQPFVPTSAWAAVAQRESPIAIARMGVQRTPPVRLERSVWPLLPTTGDVGARSVMVKYPHLVSEVTCEGSSVDLDAQSDFELWEQRNPPGGELTFGHAS